MRAYVVVSEHNHTRTAVTPLLLTKLELTLEGEPYYSTTTTSTTTDDDDDDGKGITVKRPFSFPSRELQDNFLVWTLPASVTALPSNQVLLVETGQKTYINGRAMTLPHPLPPALFGFNLKHCVAVWHGRIKDLDALQQTYSTLWQEILIDARFIHLDIASILLQRLMYGADDDDDDDDDDVNATSLETECLESLVMASSQYDPVGICAKALATRFAQEFGKSAVPCMAHEVEWYKHRMGHRIPVVVPQRLMNILRRGGYFDLQRETNEVWFTENIRPATDGMEQEAVEEAMKLLNEAGCDEERLLIMFVKLDAPDPVKNKFMCRYNEMLMQYHVNEAVWKLDKPAKAIALYVAQEHPNGRIVLNLLMSNQAPSSVKMME